MRDKDDNAWFAPKRYGYGTGLPIAWQGWALLAALVAIVLGAVPLAAKSTLAYILVAGAAMLVFAIICARKTRGGWRGRWGEKD